MSKISVHVLIFPSLHLFCSISFFLSFPLSTSFHQSIHPSIFIFFFLFILILAQFINSIFRSDDEQSSADKERLARQENSVFKHDEADDTAFSFFLLCSFLPPSLCVFPYLWQERTRFFRSLCVTGTLASPIRKWVS